MRFTWIPDKRCALSGMTTVGVTSPSSIVAASDQPDLVGQLDRHNPAVDSLLRYIVMDVIPAAKLGENIRLAK